VVNFLKLPGKPVFFTFLLLIVFLLAGLLLSVGNREPATVRVGILHSLTGTMAFSEKPLVDALLLAIDEVNQQGGVLGKKIEAVIVDGQSDWEEFARQAERLIVEEKVAVIFGCWTSACRKAIKPVVEKYQQLLFYPLQYEGMEASPDIVYTGAVANQQITPSIHWAFEHLGKKFYLLGSDYIFPRTANLIIKDLVLAQQGEVVAERYLPLGEDNMEEVIADIAVKRPDVIINSINGDSNIAFFKALQQIKKIPVISYSIAEPELAQIGSQYVQGHYAVWSYFQSSPRPENHTFIKKFKQYYGQDVLLNDPMEASYIGVKLWAKAVEHAHSLDPQRIKTVIGYVTLNAPEGIVSVDAQTHHLWKTIQIAQVRDDGQFDIVWQSEKPLRPEPFPFWRNPRDWLYLQMLLTAEIKK